MLWAAAVAVIPILYGLHRAALWAERKGWVYYRNARPPGTVSTALMEIERYLHPEIEYVLEARVAEGLDQLRVGEPGRKVGAIQRRVASWK